MEQLSAWVGAGLVTAGVSAALLAGAGLASADSGAGAQSASSSSPSSSSSDSAGSDAKGADAKGADAKRADAPKPRPKPESEPTSGEPKTAKDATVEKDAEQTTTGTATETAGQKTPEPTADDGDRPAKHATAASDTPRKKPQPAEPAVTAPADPAPAVEQTPTEPVVKHVAAQNVATQNVATQNVGAQTVTAPTVTARTIATAAPSTLVQAVAPMPATPSAPTLLGVIQGVVAAVVVNVGSLVFNTVQALEALVTGPPVLPPGSTVTVRSSTILLSTGQRVAANWYYPEGTDVPEHMILLQHGFLALGPMYSYTAANLAANTQSIVVTPTLSSNPFAGDANWLGGATMAASIGDLFEGNREALTQSAIDAGFAERYGVDAVLPRKFALAGHSLGANLVSGAAGHLADDCTIDACAAADLAGVILLDGVPLAATLPAALSALNGKESLTGFIPIREIGAPWNLYNSTSNVNEALTAARPDRYKGVVLDGGVHSDPMQGGNPLIQFALYVAAGFPQPPNPPAVDELSVQWFNEWFAGQTSLGDDLVGGATLDVPTPKGAAHGVVIGNPPAVTRLPSTIPAVDPVLASLAA